MFIWKSKLLKTTTGSILQCSTSRLLNKIFNMKMSTYMYLLRIYDIRNNLSNWKTNTLKGSRFFANLVLTNVSYIIIYVLFLVYFDYLVLRFLIFLGQSRLEYDLFQSRPTKPHNHKSLKMSINIIFTLLKQRTRVLSSVCLTGCWPVFGER